MDKSEAGIIIIVVVAIVGAIALIFALSTPVTSKTLQGTIVATRVFSSGGGAGTSYGMNEYMTIKLFNGQTVNYTLDYCKWYQAGDNVNVTIYNSGSVSVPKPSACNQG